jgi:hypothetical protein
VIGSNFDHSIITSIAMGVTREEIVPGTVHLVDLGHEVTGKHLGGNADIVLVPQPSSDPEDPLNWSPKRKGFAIGMVFCYTLGVAISTAVQYSGATRLLALPFKRSWS